MAGGTRLARRAGWLARASHLPCAVLEGRLRAGDVALELAIPRRVAKRIGGAVESLLRRTPILLASGPGGGVEGIGGLGQGAGRLRL